MGIKKYLNRKYNKADVDIDIIRGRRLTDAESMHLMLPDLPIINEEALEEAIAKYVKWK